MRIAIAGISNENSNFSPIPNRLADFSVLADEALLTADRYPFLGEFPGVTFLPTLFAGSLPGGPIAADTYHTLKAGILSRLQAAGPVDGVYLDLHGAMYVEGLRDAEADLAGSIRQIVGREPDPHVPDRRRIADIQHDETAGAGCDTGQALLHVDVVGPIGQRHLGDDDRQVAGGQ